ncbi:TPA: hypothetical protein J8J82_001266 [Legionella pneumophila]|nr:hypothetical protein [Legionella pneumophila]HBA1636338.1 hypothetical protein [Legionella pneumophila]
MSGVGIQAYQGVDGAGSNPELTLAISKPGNIRQLFDEIEKLKRVLDKSKLFPAVSDDLRIDTMRYNIDLDYNQLAKLGLIASQVAKNKVLFKMQ